MISNNNINDHTTIVLGEIPWGNFVLLYKQYHDNTTKPMHGWYSTLYSLLAYTTCESCQVMLSVVAISDM